jgi:hypothetical protein
MNAVKEVICMSANEKTDSVDKKEFHGAGKSKGE